MTENDKASIFVFLVPFQSCSSLCHALCSFTIAADDQFPLRPYAGDSDSAIHFASGPSLSCRKGIL
jgi:hypothetical protein